MKKLVALLLALIMVFALCACGSTETAEEPAAEEAVEETTEVAEEAEEAEEPTEAEVDPNAYLGKTLTVALDDEPTSLLPQAGTPTKCEQTTTMLLYGYLYSYNADGELVPDVATGYEWVDDLTMRVFIREGIICPDGSELTAQDVIFSWQLGTEGTNASMYNGNFDIENWECEDDYTLLIKFTAPYPTFPSVFCSDSYVIVDQSSYEALGSMEAACLNPQCGTGKYKFSEWKSGQYMTFEYNEDYWDDTYVPQYQYIKFIFIADGAARCLAVQSGDADIAEQVALSTTLSYEGDDSVAVQTVPSTSAVPFFLNCQSEPFQNPQVREAIGYLIDFEALNDSYSNGLAEPIMTTISSESQYYYDYYDRTYDPDYGKQLLEEAGYGDGFTIKLFAEPSDGYSDMCELIQYYLSYANITTEIEYAGPTNFFDTVQNYKYDIFFSGTSNNVNFMCAYYDNRPDAALMCGGANYSDEDLWAILDVITTTFDEDERVEKFEELQKFVIDNNLAFGVCTLCSYSLYNTATVGTIPHSGAGGNLLAYVTPAV